MSSKRTFLLSIMMLVCITSTDLLRAQRIEFEYKKQITNYEQNAFKVFNSLQEVLQTNSEHAEKTLFSNIISVYLYRIEETCKTVRHRFRYLSDPLLMPLSRVYMLSSVSLAQTSHNSAIICDLYEKALLYHGQNRVISIMQINLPHGIRYHDRYYSSFGKFIGDVGKNESFLNCQ